MAIHTTKYYDTVNARLAGVESYEDVIRILKEIADAILNGIFPY